MPNDEHQCIMHKEAQNHEFLGKIEEKYMPGRYLGFQSVVSIMSETFKSS